MPAKAENKLTDESIWRNVKLSWQNPAIQRKKPFVERFWEKVNKNGKQMSHVPELGNCWEWMGVISIKGYGMCPFPASWNRRIDGKHYKNLSTHRISWMIQKGKIPSGLVIMHKCDNRKCCRIEHLEIGTTKDNVNDCWKKGRRTAKRGEDCYNSFLKKEDVVKMKEMRLGGASYYKIASCFNIGTPYCWQIINGKRWKHIKT